ncbi:MAG: hypothetical protein CHACPFDD_03641 [Phycisphaerae bacterium]|nr:hypothetical protein [Phycisphaerae bacterium]
MAQKDASKPAAAETSPVDQAKARRWFAQAKQVTESRNYDYGIECYVTGLGFWPDAVEEGHKPLRAVAMQRLMAGGKKPGMMDQFKKSTNGKDVKQNLLNACELLAKDPKNATYMEPLLKNAVKLGCAETAKWVAPILIDGLKNEKKPSAARFKAAVEMLEEAADAGETAGRNTDTVWFLEQAVAAADAVARLLPGDGPAATQLRNLSGKLTIVRGKYRDGESFRDSLRDAEKSKLLHDGDRVVQSDDAVDHLITAARAEYEANPGVPGKVMALVEHLLRRERKKDEDDAMAVLGRAYKDSNNYNFKSKLDDIRLRQVTRQVRELKARAEQTGSEEDRQQLRLANAERVETEIEVWSERMAAYPTDLRVRFRYGMALFAAKRWDEAIPVFQESQVDPRNRTQSLFYMGRCFYEKQIYDQARHLLDDAARSYEIEGDATSKDIAYWQGRAAEAAGDAAGALEAYGRLLRSDYNYLGGEVRQRVEALKKG